MDLIKPKLKYLTTIDFGRAIYERDFFSLLRENRLAVREDRVLKGKWLNSQSRMIVASFQETGQPSLATTIRPRIVEAGRSRGNGRHPTNAQSTASRQ